MAAPTLLSVSGTEVPQRLGGHQERFKVKSKLQSVAQILFKAHCLRAGGAFWM